MASANEQLRVLEVLKRDEWSVVGRGIDVSGDGPQLVRRLIQSKRDDDEARSSLRAEAEYGARIDHPNAPRAELVEYDSGELVLRYANREGIELDRVLYALNARGWVLSARAAAVMMAPPIEVSALISKQPPPDMGLVESFGHGEIAPRSLLLGRDGLCRLYEARCAATALPWSRTADGKLCLAPELPRPMHAGTAEGDVFAIAAVLAASVVGIRRLAAVPDVPLHEAFERETLLLEGINEIDRGFAALVIRALSSDPQHRLALRSMSLALRHGLGLDEDRSNQLRLGLADLVALLSERRDLMDVPEDYRHRWSEVIVAAPPPRRSQSAPPRPSTQDILPGTRPAPSGGFGRSVVPRGESRAIPPASMTDVSRGFALEVLDDWSTMSRHLTGTFSVPHTIRDRARKRRRRNQVINAALIIVIISVLGGGLLFWIRQEQIAASLRPPPTELLVDPAQVIPPPAPEAPAADPTIEQAEAEVSPTAPPVEAARPPSPRANPRRPRAVRAPPEPPPPTPAAAPEATKPEPTKEEEPGQMRLELPADKPAKMIVSVSPPARVWIDGQDAGFPPVLQSDLAPGEHVVRVEHEGFETVIRRVALRSGEDKRLRIVLERKR